MTNRVLFFSECDLYLGFGKNIFFRISGRILVLNAFQTILSPFAFVKFNGVSDKNLSLYKNDDLLLVGTSVERIRTEMHVVSSASFYQKPSEMVWNHLKSFEIVWNHLKPPETAWNRLETSKNVQNPLKSSKIVWDCLKWTQNEFSTRNFFCPNALFISQLRFFISAAK